MFCWAEGSNKLVVGLVFFNKKTISFPDDWQTRLAGVGAGDEKVLQNLATS